MRNWVAMGALIVVMARAGAVAILQVIGSMTVRGDRACVMIIEGHAHSGRSRRQPMQRNRQGKQD